MDCGQGVKLFKAKDEKNCWYSFFNARVSEVRLFDKTLLQYLQDNENTI